MEEAFKLAAEGRTNVEIFAKLNLSVGELRRRIKVDHELVFAIVNGRASFIQQFIDKLVEAQVSDEFTSSINVGICKYMVEKYSNENAVLAQAYDSVVSDSLLSAQVKQEPLTREQVTSQLRSLK